MRASHSKKILVVLAALFPLTSVRAQTTGAINGFVVDATNQNPVKDAVVIAQSPSLQGEQTAVTDDVGQFEITLLPAGTYKLVVQREGFQPFTQDGLTVRLDRTLKIRLSIAPEALTGPSVEIVAQRPSIAVDSVQTGNTVTSAQMSLIPYGRNTRTFEAVATSIPGIQTDRYGLQVSGASSPENTYIIDGVNVGNPAFGTQGTTLIQDFVQEVDVKTGGYRAEYGRSTGGVINVVTKSGGNEFHGSVFANLTPFEATRKQVARRGEAIAAEQSQRYNLDFGAELGGPILKDKLWFFAGFAPQIVSINNARVILAKQSDPNGQPKLDANGNTLTTEVARKTYATTETSYQFSGKLTYLVNENHSVALAAYGNPTKRTGVDADPNAPVVPSLRGTEGTFLAGRTRGSTDLSLRYFGKLFSKTMLIEATAGYHHQVDSNSPGTLADSPNMFWRVRRSLLDPAFTADPGTPDYQRNLADCAIQANGFDPCPVAGYSTGGLGGLVDRTGNRILGILKLSNFVELAGHHQFKYGGDIARDTWDNTQSLTGKVTAQFRSTAQGFRWRIRQYGHENPATPGLPAFDPANPDQLADPSFTKRTVNHTFAAFAQDTWSIADKVVLDAGVRLEHQLIFGDRKTLDPTGTTSLAGSGPQVNLTNVAPRIGLIYDWTGRGLSKVYASFGRFYDYIALELADFDLSALTQVQYFRDPNACKDPRDPRTCALITPASGRPYQFQGSFNSTAVDRNLTSQYTQEFQGGVQYQVYRDFSMGVEYTHRSLEHVVEDISADHANTYFITNPGLNGTQGRQVIEPDTGKVVIEPLARRLYDAVTLTVNKNFSDNYQVSASYTYSQLRGNYNGLILPENGELLPHVNTEYDFLSVLSNKSGPMAGDVPNSFKLSGGYVYEVNPKLALNFGANFRAEQGIPINVLGAAPEIYGSTFILPRGSGGRLPWLHQLDLRAAAVYRLSSLYRLGLSVDLLNVYNRQAASSVDESYTGDNLYPIVNGKFSDLAYLTTADGVPVTRNTNFKNPTSFQRPFSARFGVKLMF